MEKQNEKQPVDDLFARKLKTMSLPPGPDGFARLQARMGKSASETKVLVWHNSANRRYMAIAACLLLTCLFGWLYLSTETPEETVVGMNKPVEQRIDTSPRLAINPADKLAKTSPESARKEMISAKRKPGILALNKPGKQISNMQTDDGHLIAEVGRAGREERELPRSISNAVPLKQVDQFANVKPDVHPVETVNDKETVATVSKSAPIAERVLVVTIAEPEVLSVARRTTAAVADENVASTTDKPDRESKAAGFWNQMKRLKQGEAFARKEAADDERGLLGRAYSGLKQSFDKDKSVKQ